MTPERMIKIEAEAQRMPTLVGRDGWDEVYGPSFDAEGKPDSWGNGIVAVSQHYESPEALGMFLSEAKGTILELCHALDDLAAESNRGNDEYERVCEALSTTLRLLREAKDQRDQVQKERDYFFSLAGGWIINAWDRGVPHTHVTAVANGFLQAVQRVGGEESPQWPAILRAEVEKWLADHGDQVI